METGIEMNGGNTYSTNIRTFKMILEYDGTHFFGWQIQPDRRTVQDELEKSIRTIFSSHVRVNAAGRTDTGVHATGQTVSFQLSTEMPAERIKRALNGLLPRDMSVVDISEVPERFNARFDARSRTYRYTMSSRRVSYGRAYTWHVKYPLDRSLLKECTQYLSGECSLRGFSKGSDDDDYRTVIFDNTWIFDGHIMIFEIRGVRFFHHAVRSIVGTAVEIARGSESADLIKQILETENRSLAGPTAPARGLCLTSVEYGD